MNYGIIATLGPSSANQVVWQQMLDIGVTGFRLNTSHLSIDMVFEWMEKLAAFYHTINMQVPLVLDLQGSKWRLGQFAPCELFEGDEIRLIHAASTERQSELPVPHQDFFSSASSTSSDINLNDSKIHLSILRLDQESILAKVVRGGLISPGKGITLPASLHRKEALTEKDRTIVDQTRSLDFTRYAVSYVRDAAEMARYRQMIGDASYLVAKLERESALEQAPEIAGLSNELWLCRGDLGAELGEKAMAEAVHSFSNQMQNLPVPVFLAGQVLEHMTREAAPTRSEICYLYEALKQGYCGFVLSDETSIGQYPLASCRSAALFKEKTAQTI